MRNAGWGGAPGTGVWTFLMLADVVAGPSSHTSSLPLGAARHKSMKCAMKCAMKSNPNNVQAPAPGQRTRPALGGLMMPMAGRVPPRGANSIPTDNLQTHCLRFCSRLSRILLANSACCAGGCASKSPPRFFARAHGMWTYEPRQGRKAATAVCSASAVVTLAFSFQRGAGGFRQTGA